MRDLALPISITLLAIAIFVHATVPARADIPPYPEPMIPEVQPVPPIQAGLPPECRGVHLGTQREYEKLMGELYASGRDQFTVVGSGLVCGWR